MTGPDASKSHVIDGVQILRALAATAVVIHHAMEEAGAASSNVFPSWLTTVGAAGVDTFFVISGYIMLKTSFDVWRDPVSPKDFLRKRATRIYPFYWVCCLAMCFVLSIGLLHAMPRDPGFLIRSFVLLPSPGYLIDVSWTLAYEVLFYTFFGSALFSRSRNLTTLITLVVISSTVLGFQITSGRDYLQVFLRNPIMLEFGFGMVLAWGLRGRTTAPRLWVGVLAASMCCLACVVVPHENTNGLPGFGRVIGWGLPSVLIVWTALRFQHCPRGLGRAGVSLGNASYALYLTHPFIMVGYAFLLKHSRLAGVNQSVIVPLVTAAAIVVGVMAHEGVERPLLSLIARVTRRSVGVASPSEELRGAK